MIIEKKCWPEYFKKILDGTKKFEVRLADFDCKEGDKLLLREWNPQTQKYTGRKITKNITFVFRTKELDIWPKEEIDKYGLQIISID